MADDPTRTAFEIALRAALRDQARASATIEFLREKLGLAESNLPIVLGPGEGDQEDEIAPRDVGPVTVGDAEFYGMSQTKAAAILLERAGRTRPQRTEAIIAALKKGGVEFKGKDPVQTFYAILARTPTFHRVGKSLWGLAAWYPESARKPSKINASAAPDADAAPTGGPSSTDDSQERPADEP